jgi:hypothetical protein
MSHEIAMYRGDDREFTFTLTAGGATYTGLADATSFRFTAKRRMTDALADAVIALSGPGSGVELTTDGSDGKLTVTIPASDTAELGSKTKLLWDIEVTDDEGAVRTWPEDSTGRPQLGVLWVYGDVSRT